MVDAAWRLAPWHLGCFSVRYKTADPIFSGCCVFGDAKMPMGPLPKTSKLQCPRDGCHSKGVFRAGQGVASEFGGGSVQPALEELWQCAVCEQLFIKSN